MGLTQTLTACRVCEGRALEAVLDLGSQPPANSLRRDKSQPLPAFPLVLCRCAACGTLQLSETVSPSYLFSDYPWVTGTSKAAQDYSRAFCDRLLERSRGGALFVLEVASNDGTFLQPFRERGHRILGVDPAQNVARLANQAGVPTLTEFFGVESARRLVAQHGPADAVIARNVIPHVADVRDVLEGIALCLARDGVGAIEFHRADLILRELHYDSIYHEHLCYHSLHSVARLLEPLGLTPFDALDGPLNGGSLAVYFSKQARPLSEAFKTAMRREDELGLDRAEPWRAFAKRCKAHRSALQALIGELTAHGGRLIGYGASARSATLLNFCGIDHRQVALLADRNPLKHERYAPGSDIPIVAPQEAFAQPPDAVLLTAWNFRDEILGLIRAEHGWRGDVLLPLPGDPRVVSLQ